MNRTAHLQAGVVPKRALGKKLLGAAVAGACLAIAPAHAGVIDFEGFFGPTTHTDYIQQAGFDIGFYSNAPGALPGEDLVGTFIDGSDTQACIGGSCPVNNPTTYYANLDDSYIDIMSSTPGAQFKISSFDASFIGGTAPGTIYPAVSGLLRIQGFYFNGGSATETYQLAGPSPSGFNFGHYNTSAGFASQAFVEAVVFGFACNAAGSCSAFSTDRGQFGIDNLVLAQVPEPSSFLLFGLGMIGMGAVVRRRAGSTRSAGSALSL